MEDTVKTSEIVEGGLQIVETKTTTVGYYELKMNRDRLARTADTARDYLAGITGELEEAEAMLAKVPEPAL